MTLKFAIEAIFEQISLYFPCYQGLALRRLVSQDCVHHHPVLANRGGFQVRGNHRYFSGLPVPSARQSLRVREQAFCWIIRDEARRSSPRQPANNRSSQSAD
jgi:hypothetical protein